MKQSPTACAAVVPGTVPTLLVCLMYSAPEAHGGFLTPGTPLETPAPLQAEGTTETPGPMRERTPCVDLRRGGALSPSAPGADLGVARQPTPDGEHAGRGGHGRQASGTRLSHGAHPRARAPGSRWPGRDPSAQAGQSGSPPCDGSEKLTTPGQNPFSPSSPSTWEVCGPCCRSSWKARPDTPSCRSTCFAKGAVMQPVRMPARQSTYCYSALLTSMQIRREQVWGPWATLRTPLGNTRWAKKGQTGWSWRRWAEWANTGAPPPSDAPLR